MCCVLQCLCAVAVVVSVEVYRMALRAALYWHNSPLLYNYAEIVVSATGAVINLVAIFILEFVSNVFQWLHCVNSLWLLINLGTFAT